MKFLLVLFIFPILVHAQTCEIIYITPSKITVGADSRKTKIILYKDRSGKRKIFLKTDITRKILNQGKYYFVFAGSPDSLLRTIAANSCKEELSIAAVGKTYSKRVLPVLKQYWEKIRKIDTAFYRDNLVLSQVTFFGFEQEHPTVISCTFVPLSNDPLLPVSFRYSEIDLSKTDMPYAMGHYDNIQSELNNKSLWQNQPARLLIKQLIEKQALATPNIVGKPIDMLELTYKGAIWYPKRKSKGKN